MGSDTNEHNFIRRESTNRITTRNDFTADINVRFHVSGKTWKARSKNSVVVLRMLVIYLVYFIGYSCVSKYLKMCTFVFSIRKWVNAQHK